MPPRRPRSSQAKTTEPPAKRARMAESPPASLPKKPVTDSYKPPSHSKTKARAAITDAVKHLPPQSSKSSVQLRISVSTTEADAVSQSLETLKKTTRATFTVSTPVEGAVDADVIITGTHKQVVSGVSFVSLLLQELIQPVDANAVELHTTLSLPSSVTKEMQWVEEESACDLSDEFVPFSSYKTLYLDAGVDEFASLVLRVIEDVERHESQDGEITPEIKVPVIGTHVGKTTRPAVNQQMLERSKSAYAKFLSDDHDTTMTDAVAVEPEEEDPVKLSKQAIQDAIKDCESKVKTLNGMRTQVDVPVDSVPAIIGKGGSKINEIRARSGCNVSVEDTVKQGMFRTVVITGLPEGILTALNYLFSIVK